MSTQADFARTYREALTGFLASGDEEGLQRAYELGRQAMTEGLGVLDVAALHEEAVMALLRVPPTAERATALQRAFGFFTEALASFEMGLRGFREANETLQRLNDTLEVRNTELASARDDAERKAAESDEIAASERRARLEVQETHEQLKQAQAQLVQSEKLVALGQLVAGVAHEVNNPLAFVINNAAVMRRDVRLLHDMLTLYREGDPVLAGHQPALWERVRELAERVDLDYTLENLEGLLTRSRDGLARIQRIVLDLRNFARLDEGDLHEVDLNASVESTINMIRFRAREQQVTLEVELGALPRVACYPAKVNQIVLNLTANAIDACAPGCQVTIRTCAAEDGVQIQVLDNGAGIDPAHRDRIFDPFFTTKPVGKGTGLGLSISHGIVAEHGGHIKVDSTPGRGTCFTVWLPRRPPAEGAGGG